MRIRTRHNKSWQILEIDHFTNSKGEIDNSVMGMCEPNNRQIIIRKEQTNKFSTLIHETIHAIDFDYGIGLSENQVMKLEEGIMRVIKLNKLFRFWESMQ